MLVQINFNSGKPPYLQVVDQVKTAIASGLLQAGDSLPPIRALAEQLRINRNTVAKAYAELENQGVIENLVGRGCYVNQNHSPLTREVRRKMMLEEIDALLVKAHHLQLDPNELLGWLKERMPVFDKRNDLLDAATIRSRSISSKGNA
jgi:GntR family transcriptional regulator